MKENIIDIRDATEKDLAAILDIYNYAIMHTTAVYHYKPHTIAMRRQWFEEHSTAHFPVIVAEMENKVVGFATYSTFRPWAAYQYTAEHSVYVHPDYFRKGIASELLKKIITLAAANRIHTLVAGIDASNAASIILHEKFGFERVGLMKEVGYKFGKWLDLDFYQLILPLNFTPDAV